MARTRIKICGITRVEDGAAAIAAGADALGLVFWPPSKRYVTVDVAKEVASLPGPFCARVGVFVDPAPEYVRETLRRVPLTCLQFHGNESADYCRSFGMPYLKALRMKDEVDLDQMARDYVDAQGLLLDSYVPELPGGTGESFAWGRARYADPEHPQAKPLILAGGLTADNIAKAISVVQPYGVDVSGGLEGAPGIKNPRLIVSFCEAVRIADTGI